MTIDVKNLGGGNMSDQRRERQLQRAAEALVQPNRTQEMPPELKAIIEMEPAARQCIFFVDLLHTQIGGMINQLGMVGGVRFAGAFLQLQKGLEGFRGQVLQREGAARIAIAQPGDVPPAPKD